MMATTMSFVRPRRALARGALCLASAAAVSGCMTTPWSGQSQPPVRTPGAAARSAGVAAGYYRVNPGDTLASIAAAYGQRPQDIASWNHVPAAAPVVPGQILRVAPPVAANAAAAPGPTLRFAWPAHGAVIVPFQPGRSKGIVIAGMPGDPVTAAADGRVVYVGSGIKEYGPLIVIKHNDTFITAYGHNGRMLVNEGDAVKEGQVISEMGADPNGHGAVQFEIRRDGTPVDPMPYLSRSGG
jgi:lipoprotein NlpD